MKPFCQFLSICLFLVFFNHSVYGFTNPYRKTNGQVLKVKELSDNTMLAIFRNDDSGYTELSHISAHGDSLSTAILCRKNQNYYFHTIYEYNGEYVVTMGSVEGDSANLTRYVEFRFYDSSLSLSRIFKHIVDVNPKKDLLNNNMNDQLIWAGQVRQGQNSYLKTIQFEPSGGKVNENLTQLLSFDTAYLFIKPISNGKGNTVFVFNQYNLSRYDFDHSLNLIGHDTFPRIYNIDSSGKSYRCDWASDIISINDSLYIALTADTTGVGDAWRGPASFSIIKIQGNKIISNTELGEQQYLLVMLATLFNSIFNYLYCDNVKQEIYVRSIFVNSNSDQSGLSPFALKYSNRLDSLDALILKPSSDIDSVYSIQTFNIIHSGIYIIGGSTKSGKGFLGVADTLGLVSGVQNIQEPNEVIIFPNPGREFIYGIPEQSTLMLIDISGKQIIMKSAKNGCDISNLKSGIYFYKIADNTGNIISTGKYIKE